MLCIAGCRWRRPSRPRAFLPNFAPPSGRRLLQRAAGSPKTMPPKRAANETQAETQAVVKRYRQAIDEAVEEYVCPITAELPIDPVTAEDGRFYERHAIEEWFSRQPEAQVKSPMTNELMGKRLLPAMQCATRSSGSWRAARSAAPRRTRGRRRWRTRRRWRRFG